MIHHFHNILPMSEHFAMSVRYHPCIVHILIFLFNLPGTDHVINYQHVIHILFTLPTGLNQRV